MGKRAGEFVTLREVIDEVGADAARFFFLLRKADSARSSSTSSWRRSRPPTTRSSTSSTRTRGSRACYRQAAAAGVVAGRQSGLDPLGAPRGRAVRALARYPEVVETAARELEPHRMVFYLQELAATSIATTTSNRILTEDRGGSRPPGSHWCGRPAGAAQRARLAGRRSPPSGCEGGDRYGTTG